MCAIIGGDEQVAKNNLIIQGKDITFEENVLKGDPSVLFVVDFWAPWCRPCVALGKVIDDSVKLDSFRKVRVYKMNVDEEQETAGKYNVSALPTLVFIKNGKLIKTQVGSMNKDAFIDLVEGLIEE